MNYNVEPLRYDPRKPAKTTLKIEERQYYGIVKEKNEFYLRVESSFWFKDEIKYFVQAYHVFAPSLKEAKKIALEFHSSRYKNDKIVRIVNVTHVAYLWGHYQTVGYKGDKLRDKLTRSLDKK